LILPPLNMVKLGVPSSEYISRVTNIAGICSESPVPAPQRGHICRRFEAFWSILSCRGLQHPNFVHWCLARTKTHFRCGICLKSEGPR
jgi:hypothetical protein